LKKRSKKRVRSGKRTRMRGVGQRTYLSNTVFSIFSFFPSTLGSDKSQLQFHSKFWFLVVYHRLFILSLPASAVPLKWKPSSFSTVMIQIFLEIRNANFMTDVVGSMNTNGQISASRKTLKRSAPPVSIRFPFWQA